MWREPGSDPPEQSLPILDPWVPAIALRDLAEEVLVSTEELRGLEA